MATYKTRNGQRTGFVPGVGEIAGGLIQAPDDWQHGSNFEKVETPAKPAPAPTANPVPAAPVASAPPPASQPPKQETA